MKKKLNIVVVGYIVVGIILCALVGNALAKYFQTSSNPSTFKAMDFFFTSNLLDEGTHTLAPGATTMSFSLRNHADELKISEVDVEITGITVSGEGNPTVNYDNRKLTANTIDHIDVTVSGLVPGDKYVITATAVGGRENDAGGYRKTLTGTIIIPPPEETVYKYLKSYGTYVLLTVWSQGYKGDVTVDIPDGIIPDNTDSVMESAVTGGILTDNTSFATNSYSSHTYRFFVNGRSVTENDFTVTYDGGKKANYRMP